MEDLFKVLLPLIVMGLVGLGKWMESRQGGDQTPAEPSAGEREAEATRRALREQIRQEIARRQAEARGEAPPAEARADQPSPQPSSQTGYDPTVPDWAQAPRRPAETPVEQPARQAAPAQPSPWERIEEAYQDSPYSAGMDALNERIARQQQEADRTRREADEAREQARVRIERAMAEHGEAPKKHRGSAYGLSRRSSRGLSVQDDIRLMLRDAQGARKGFLFHEILGTPVGLREDGRIKPSWEA